MKRSWMMLGMLWVFSAATAAAQSGSSAERLSTPRSAVNNFLKWQLPPTVDMDIASEAMGINPGMTTGRRRELARQLKAVLDARGLLVHVDTIPADPDYVDESSGQRRYQLFPVRLPEVVVVKAGERWMFSRRTLVAVPTLYDQTFSAAAQYLIDLLPAVFQMRLLGIALWQYAGVFLVLLIAFVTRKISEFFLRKFANWLIKHTPPKWDENIVLQSVKPVSFLIFTLFIRLFYADLQLPVRMNAAIKFALEVMIAGSLLWLAFKLVDFFCDHLRRITAKTDTKLDDQLIPLLRKALKVFGFTIGALVLVQSFGYSISSVLAGLGIGGVAVALAAQDTIANFFGSVMIFADKPFQIGDWIITGKVEGTVEEVGFRSTRIRTFYNSVISVPNSKLASSDVDNLGLRRYRRIKEVLSLTYSTTAQQMQAFVEGIRAIIQANRYMRKDFYEIHFNGYGNSSLNVLVYCFLEVDSWSDELREKHNFFLEILRLAEELGVEFAFPTQTVHVDSFYGDKPRVVGKKRSSEKLAETVASFGPDGGLSRPHGPELMLDGKKLDYSPQGATTRGAV